MSFQPGVPRSACVTRDPPGSRRSSRPSRDETISSRPSGSQAVHSGSESTRAITSLWPARSTATTSPAYQSEKYSRSSCQRGDSTRPRPVSSVRIPSIVMSLLRHGRREPKDPVNAPSPATRTTARRIDRWRPGLLRVEEGDHGENPPVVVGRGRQPQRGEDVADVLSSPAPAISQVSTRAAGPGPPAWTGRERVSGTAPTSGSPRGQSYHLSGR